MDKRIETVKKILTDTFDYCNAFPDEESFQSVCLETATDIVGQIDALVREKIALLAENKKLKMMIDNGLGWEDMTNDIAPMQER